MANDRGLGIGQLFLPAI